MSQRLQSKNKAGKLPEVRAKAEAFGGWGKLVEAIILTIPHRPLPEQLEISVRNKVRLPNGY